MTLQVKLYDAVVAREGSSRLNRPLVKFVKHGGLCLAISLDRLILVRCGDMSSNPGPHQKTLSCLMQNVRSLKAFQLVDGSSYESKLGILRNIAYGYDLDVICLTETWLNEAITDHEILPTAYNIYRRDRVGRTGGGVMTAIKSSLSSFQLKVPSDFSSLEMVVVEINNFKYDRSILLINCYRPPNNDQFVGHFSDFMKSLVFGRYYSVIASGDLGYCW